MSTIADTEQTHPHVFLGFGIALISAGTFAMSGPLARGLLASGWSPAAAVCIRVLGAVFVLAIPAARVLDGRWHLLRSHFKILFVYGAGAVMMAQLGFFNAVKHMSVAASLLMEYTAPVAVVVWMWVAHKERPPVLTIAGAVVAAAGLTLVLDLYSGAEVSGIGVAWGLFAMVGCAMYFILSAHENELPPLVLACGGLLIGGLSLALLGAVGILDFSMSTADADFNGVTTPWWVPMLGLIVVTAAIAYTTGIIASRMLGARLASFVALSEVVFAVIFAWIFVGETPQLTQLAGGLLILGGVIVVKLGERAPELDNPLNPV